jgi:4-hydroxythreonine-4-phosphate dehydrogenase
MGCPSGVGPELVAEFLDRYPKVPLWVVGDRAALLAGARAKGVSLSKIEALEEFSGPEPKSLLVQVGDELAVKDRRPGKPSALGGERQLLYIERAFELARAYGLPLSTLPVSKEAVARSGLRRARSFRGHTEWLEALDGAPYSVMCFAAEKLIVGLVTTHLPLRKVPQVLEPELVRRAVVEVSNLARALGKRKPHIAVCSLNPHAGEGELLGREEELAIVPGVEAARRELGARAKVTGPIGAETAIRKAAAGVYDAAVAIYHDQATIPMKLLDFGGTVNVTQGLSIVRTSVDHGTAYDIAGTGQASLRGFESAVDLAQKLATVRR